MAQEMHMTEPLVVTIQEAADLLGVGYQVICRMMSEGQIPENKIARVGRARKINRRFILSLAGEGGING